MLLWLVGTFVLFTVVNVFKICQLLQPFHGFLNFVRDNPGEPVCSFTHSHLSWSS